MQAEPNAIPALDGQLFALPMTIPLWGLVIFIFWTIAVVLLLIVRIRRLAAGGSPQDFGTPNNDSLLWRLFRVQSNLIENLPLDLGTIFLVTVRGVSGAVIDGLVSVYIIFRLFHSIVHIGGANLNLRVFSLVVQFCCLISLMVLSIFHLSPVI